MLQRNADISAGLCKVGNDANMAALGEFWKGSAKGYQSVMLVTVGTGVGGGLIIDGKPVAGVHGAAAEIGHLPIVEGEQEACNCGKRLSGAGSFRDRHCTCCKADSGSSRNRIGS